MRIALLLITFAAFLSASCTKKPTATAKSMITLEQLQDMFTSMRTNPQLNVDGDLLWGYFFTNRDPKKLEPVAARLASAGYRVVNIYPTDDESTHFLHVERVESHTPESLHARNQEFYGLASELGIDSYDGMDVGPVL
ncbi:MAG: ribonuclease E inhibitor RraB [Verrucomicrobiota bacterium]